MNLKRGIVGILFVVFSFFISSNNAFAIQSLELNNTENPLYQEMSPASKNNSTKADKKDKILENKKQYIRNIEISGNNVVQQEQILERLKVKRGDEYDRGLIQTDLKAIYEMGFFSEKMKAIPLENPDKSITLKIVLEENIPVTDFTIEGNKVISTEEILEYLLPLQGQPQNVITINNAIEGIQECYSSKGYILSRVVGITDDPDGTINLVINEGEINKISIQGNEKTKAYVIERNIMIEPGMVYNENAVKADLVRLYATQAFKDVNREIEPSPENPEKYDVTIIVEEQRTATVSLGGGLDSTTGVFGSIGLSDNNFRGLNQRVGLNFLVGSGMVLSDSSVTKRMNLQAELSFFEPYFIDADTSLMSKIYIRDFGSYQIPLAIEQRIGAEATISSVVKANRNFTKTFTVGIENLNVKEADASGIARLYAMHKVPISERAKQLEGGLFLTLAPGLIYDTRDTVINPRKGTYARLKFEEAIGFDFSKTHGKLTAMVRHHIPIATKSSLTFTAKAGGKIHGDNMPEAMAYRLGGPYTVRGFKMSGVGTGNAFVMGSAELSTPLFGLDRIKNLNFLENVRLTMFLDAGKVFDTSITDKLYNRPLQAISAGVGLKVYIPGLGPLSIDYGIPLTNPMGGSNKSGYFTFGVGDLMY